MPALRLCCNSLPGSWHRLSLPTVGAVQAVHPHSLGLGGERRTPSPVCGGPGIMLPQAVEPCYLWASEPGWTHLGMFSGFLPGIIPLE